MVYDAMRYTTTKKFIDIMKKRGVTISDIAEELGVSDTRVAGVLYGYTYLSDKNTILILDALESIRKKRKVVSKKTF